MRIMRHPVCIAATITAVVGIAGVAAAQVPESRSNPALPGGSSSLQETFEGGRCNAWPPRRRHA